MGAKPLLSIVTVTYRDPFGLRRTLDSLTALNLEGAAEVELIVIDGGSGPELADALIGHDPEIRVISEPDLGVYDAMNKGLRISSGGHVWFLNGGDECCLVSWAALRKELVKFPREILLADYILDTGRARLHRRSRKGSYIWHGLPTSHQAIFYPGERAREANYDLSYQVVGDYEFTARLIAGGVRTENWSEPVAVFHAGGMSQVRASTVAREAGIVQVKVLNLGHGRRVLSQVRHAMSRNLRAFQARPRRVRG